MTDNLSQVVVEEYPNSDPLTLDKVYVSLWYRTSSTLFDERNEYETMIEELLYFQCGNDRHHDGKTLIEVAKEAHQNVDYEYDRRRVMTDEETNGVLEQHPYTTFTDLCELIFDKITRHVLPKGKGVIGMYVEGTLKTGEQGRLYLLSDYGGNMTCGDYKAVLVT